MENPSQPELLRDMFIMLGSASAGLIGLLFIAASLHVKAVVNNPVFHRRAINNTCYLLIILVQALLILIRQPMYVLGAEIVAINLIGLWLPLRFVYVHFTNDQGFRRGGGSVHLGIIFSASFLLGIAGGASLIGHLNWGIYLVAASCVILLVTVVLAAWSIMVGVGRSEKAPKTKRRTPR